MLDPHMINRVSLLVSIDEYKARAQEIQDDIYLDLDYEHLHFDIVEDDLLDDLESFYMLDICPTSHREHSISTAYKNYELDKMQHHIQHKLYQFISKKEHID